MQREVLWLAVSILTVGLTAGVVEGNATGPADAVAVTRLAQAPANLAVLRAQLTGLERDWATLFAALANKRYTQITAGETDRLESLLLRFLLCREALWDMVTYFNAYEELFPDEAGQTRAFATSFHAAALLARHTSWLVLNGMAVPSAGRKLNEMHYRQDVPAGTFDMLFYSLTAPKQLEDLRNAQRSFAAEATRPDSALDRLMQADPAFAAELAQTAWLWLQADQMTGEILKQKAIVLPAAVNLLRQNELAAQTRKATRVIADNLYTAQGLLYNTVSDFKRPQTQHTVFTKVQAGAIQRSLQPGDLILTFSAGYMSNVFLPGKFKHGITYVGSPAQRAALGLTAAACVESVPASKRVRLAADLAVERLPSGLEADVIEAVAEGVIFNSLDALMHNHINRLAVLRPRLTDAVRREALLSTFLLVGCPYDFNFDFVDATYQCCTEVIYRALERPGGISFKLVPRAGVQTLAADDIVGLHLRVQPSPFEFVLLAEADPNATGGAARVLSGKAGEERLAALMAETSRALPAITLPTFKPAFPNVLPGKGK